MLNQAPLDYHAYLIAGRAEALRWLKLRFDEKRREEIARHQPEPELVVRSQSKWKIDDSRKFRELQSGRWSAGKRWLVIVCDQMVNEAEQALLKILEEPARGVQIFIITPQPEKFLPTVRSRCHIIYPKIDDKRLTSLGSKFLALSRAERLIQLEKILSADDGREKLVDLVADIEFCLTQKKENQQMISIKQILLVREWMRIAHVSPKFIGQFLAVTLPHYSNC